MEAADRQPTVPSKDTDLRHFLWLPLTLSGTGSTLGVVVLLLGSGSVRAAHKWESWVLIFLLPVLAGGASVLRTWLAPNVRVEARLAWGPKSLRILVAMVQLFRGAVFGVAAVLVGYVLWFFFFGPPIMVF